MEIKKIIDCFKELDCKTITINMYNIKSAKGYIIQFENELNEAILEKFCKVISEKFKDFNCVIINGLKLKIYPLGKVNSPPKSL